MDNLIENALEHAPAGSTVTITWGQEGGEAFIAVLDEGPGISPEDAEVAFERFQRGAARPVGRGGTGLGLAIVGALAAPLGRLGVAHPACRGRHAGGDPAAGRRRATRQPLPSPYLPRRSLGVNAHARHHSLARTRGPPGRHRRRLHRQCDREPVVHAGRRCAAIGRQSRAGHAAARRHHGREACEEAEAGPTKPRQPNPDDRAEATTTTTATDAKAPVTTTDDHGGDGKGGTTAAPARARAARTTPPATAARAATTSNANADETLGRS